MISETVLNSVEDNVHSGDLFLQRVKLSINDDAINADPRELSHHISCSIAHLQAAYDTLGNLISNEANGNSGTS